MVKGQGCAWRMLIVCQQGFLKRQHGGELGRQGYGEGVRTPPVVYKRTKGMYTTPKQAPKDVHIRGTATKARSSLAGLHNIGL